VERERLYALGEGDGEVNKTLTYLRDPTELEIAETKRASTTLLPLTEESAMAKLRQETDRLSDAMETVLKTRDTASILDSGKEVRRQFGIWLSAFRACDDHTSHQLSDAFGVSSPAFTAFRELKSQEYDRDFAYRLCWQLRNASEHAGEVINAMRVGFQAGDDGHDGRFRLISQLEPADLAARFPKMNAKVRAELQSCQGNLELILLVRSAILSWDRIHGGLLRAVWDDISPMVDVCTRLHGEALAVPGGRWAVFIDAAPEDVPDGGWHIRHNPYQRAELVTRNLVVVQSSQARHVPEFPPDMFILDEEEDPPELPI